jgi:peptidoglycan/LPS O-acetylase OafA/YrhL
MPQQLKALTSIRFLFALLVVLFHGLEPRPEALDVFPGLLKTVISHGYVGVSFFFVLSGFILSYSYAGRISKPGEATAFWWARAARILPAYYLAFFVYLPFAIVAVAVSEAPRLAALNALTIASFQLTLTHAWAPGAALAWNSPAWSLSVEACFYALFPMVLPRLEKAPSRALALLAVAAYALSQLAALMIWQIGPSNAARALADAMHFPAEDPAGYHLFYMYFPVFRIPEFLFGAVVGVLFVRRRPMTQLGRRICLALGCVGFIAGFSFFDGRVPAPLFSNGVLAPFLVMVLIGLAHSPSRIWSHPLFVRLGDASYSLYLLHMPVFLWVRALDRKSLQMQDHSFAVFFIASLVIAIGASLFSLAYIEQPSRQFIRRRFAPALAAPLAAERDFAGALRPEAQTSL